MKKSIIITSLILFIFAINFSYAPAQEIPSNQTFNYTLTMVGYENYYSYDWAELETQTIEEGTQTLVWEPNELAESIKIESVEYVKINSAYVYFPDNKWVSIGSCSKCKSITKSLGGEKTVSKIVASVSMLKDLSEITPVLGRDHVLQEDEIGTEFKNQTSINEREKINLGKVKDFNLQLQGTNNGEITFLKYKLTSTNPYISLYFSETNSTETDNGEEDIIAEFPEQIRTDLLINNTQIYATPSGLQINTSIVNNGNNPAELIILDVYVDGNYFESRIIESIVQQERIDKDLIYTATLSPGEHSITLILDAENRTLDTDKSNNIYTETINLASGSPLEEEEEIEITAVGPFIGNKEFYLPIETENTVGEISLIFSGAFSKEENLSVQATINIEGNDKDCIYNPYFEITSPSGSVKRTYILDGYFCTKKPQECNTIRRNNLFSRYRFSQNSKPYILCSHKAPKTRNLGLNWQQIRAEGGWFSFSWFRRPLYCAGTDESEITKTINMTLKQEGEYKVKIGVEKTEDCLAESRERDSQDVGSFEVGEEGSVQIEDLEETEEQEEEQNLFLGTNDTIAVCEDGIPRNNATAKADGNAYYYSAKRYMVGFYHRDFDNINGIDCATPSGKYAKWISEGSFEFKKGDVIKLTRGSDVYRVYKNEVLIKVICKECGAGRVILFY
jgi:hypothetical protein